MRRAAVACLFAAALAVGARGAQAAHEVAITFDDLPIAGVLPRDAASSLELTTKLLRAMTAHHVPVVAFVNENKLHSADGAVDPERVVLLQRWLDAGVELGNHGYSHLDLHATPLDQFDTESSFQFVDLHRKGGLTDRTFLRGSSEVFLTSQCIEIM